MNDTPGRRLRPRPGSRWAPRSRRLGGIATAVAAVMVGALASPTPAGADVSLVRDGSSSQRAAASCWEIKQMFPTLPSGAYWLQTPTLVAPARFYCDQETAGGGWVLIGRGRDGWGFTYNGQGSAADIASTPTGTGAFVPRALPARTVDGLLDGGRVDALADGVRLRRARTVDGSSFQEVRLQVTARDRWIWAADAGLPVGSWSMDAIPSGKTQSTVTGVGGTTASFGADSAYARVSTTSAAAESYRRGFAYGTGTVGDTSATSWIYKPGTGRGLPFTQVFLRPKLMSSDLTYAPVPDSGATASTVRVLPKNASSLQSWGVAGSGNGSTKLFDDEVHAFTQVGGSSMIVGGNFRTVQRGENATGADKVDQPYLASFDVTTADWRSGFRPTLNGQVLALATLPNGDVVAGGEFSTVNGSAVPGIVALDPATGQIDRDWQVILEQRTSTDRLFVRALEVRGRWLYLGGSFTHLSTPAAPTPTYARNAARIDLGTVTPDRSWRPVFDGSVNAISPSADGNRVYLAGWFHHVNGGVAERVAVLSANDATAVPGQVAPTFSEPTRNYQQAIAEAGDRVWYGGSEHMLFSVRNTDFTRLSGNITKRGGDIQVITPYAGLVFASCHCSQFVYHDAYTYPTPTGWQAADNLSFVGAWDAVTGQYVPDFLPEGLATRAGHGAWAIEPDTSGSLWVGGDFTNSRNVAGRTQWNGGFFRLGAGDGAAPSTPRNLASSRLASGQLKLTWEAASDDSGRAPTYEVLADDRVVAVPSGVSAVLDMPAQTTRFFVRAVDRTGNRSATTPALTVSPPSS